MNRRPSDAIVGALVLAALALVVGGISGFRGIVYVALFFVVGGVVLHLFEKQSKWSKILAIALVPALLVLYLKPKLKKQTPSPPNQS